MSIEEFLEGRTCLFMASGVFTVMKMEVCQESDSSAGGVGQSVEGIIYFAST